MLNLSSYPESILDNRMHGLASNSVQGHHGWIHILSAVFRFILRCRFRMVSQRPQHLPTVITEFDRNLSWLGFESDQKQRQCASPELCIERVQFPLLFSKRRRRQITYG